VKKIVYLDCPTGISGDMLLAALVDAGAPLDRICEQLKKLDLEGWQIEQHTVSRQGLAAQHLTFSFERQHHHRNLVDILALITSAGFPPKVTKLASSAFELLAEVEAKAHGCPVDQVHFHEVGAIDSILDICGVALALDYLGIEKVYCSSLPLSEGSVECQHGRIAVPAPAVMQLLMGMILVPSQLKGELITPTGAALLKAAATEQQIPNFRLLAVGSGAGAKDLAVANILRLMIGEIFASETDSVDVLRTNIDDASGELLGQLWEKAFALGALDLSYSPLLMKKGRPAWELQLIVPTGEAGRFARMIFEQTTTLGLRVSREQRIVAPRQKVVVKTVYGEIGVIVSGNTIAPEYEDCLAAAKCKNVSFKQVHAAALAAMEVEHERDLV